VQGTGGQPSGSTSVPTNAGEEQMETTRAGSYTGSSSEVASHETMDLIAADKVEGTSVYDPNGNKLGSIDTVMIDKASGKVSYAVLSFGGFLGMGTSKYPLPWNQLKYDTREGGYVVSVTEEQLKGAPNYDRDTYGDWSDRAWTSRIDDYYGASPTAGAMPGMAGSDMAGGRPTTRRPGL
jgi:sporulation protein YlmC with PRC-barrel domain